MMCIIFLNPVFPLRSLERSIKMVSHQQGMQLPGALQCELHIHPHEKEPGLFE